jgi:succinylglutamate desuccinylase
VLRRHPVLPFDLHVVIFNVEAALAGPGFAHRYLDHQEDGNRIWDGRAVDSPERRAADGILGDLLAEPLSALVDVHNTTGDNPFHAVVPDDDPATVNLATRFTTTLLRWDLANGTLMETVARYAPAVAIECGLAGRRTSFGFAVDGLRRALGPALETHAVVRDHDLVGQLLRVTLAPGIRARFGGEVDDTTDLVFPVGGDAANLDHVPAGHVLGTVRPGSACPLIVSDRDGRDVTHERLRVTDDGEVVTRHPQVPVMVVRTVEAVVKDCLCYLASIETRPAPASSSRGSSPANRSSSSLATGTSLRRTS